MGQALADAVGVQALSGGPGALARQLRRASRVACSDPGSAWLAHAVGTPAVALYGPISPLRWHPPGIRPLCASVPCHPCGVEAPARCHTGTLALRDGREERTQEKGHPPWRNRPAWCVSLFPATTHELGAVATALSTPEEEPKYLEPHNGRARLAHSDHDDGQDGAQRQLRLTLRCMPNSDCVRI